MHPSDELRKNILRSVAREYLTSFKKGETRTPDLASHLIMSVEEVTRSDCGGKNPKHTRVCERIQRHSSKGLMLGDRITEIDGVSATLQLGYEHLRASTFRKCQYGGCYTVNTCYISVDCEVDSAGDM